MMDYVAQACSAVRARIRVDTAAISGYREKGGNMPTRLHPTTGRILVGIDGSPASVAAVRWAGREAQLRGMQVHVIHVRDRRLPTPYYAPQPRAGEPPGAGTAAGETMQAVVREALGPQPAAGVQLEVADGLPARVLIDRSAGAEMLVLGSASREAGGATAPPIQARTPLGPVARDCLHAALCPVVVVRPGDVPANRDPAPAGEVRRQASRSEAVHV
jgi:nucleotide-binding universal stress UspA family protein